MQDLRPLSEEKFALKYSSHPAIYSYFISTITNYCSFIIFRFQRGFFKFNMRN